MSTLALPRSGRNADRHDPFRHVANRHRSGSEGGPASDLETRAHHASDAEKRALPDLHRAREVHARSEMGVVADDAIVIDRGAVFTMTWSPITASGCTTAPAKTTVPRPSFADG